MAAPEPDWIEVVYALPTRQEVARLPHRDGMTAGEAVEASGLKSLFPELNGAELALGIYGRRVPGTERLEPRDRVEIYRPLPADPREARRRLAAQGRAKDRRRGV